MGGVVNTVVDTVSDVVSSVGNAVSDVVDTATHIVDQATKVVSKTIDAAIADPLGTAAKIACIATGNIELLPLVSAGDVIAHGGSLQDAVKAGAIGYVTQGVAQYVMGAGADALTQDADFIAADAAQLAKQGLSSTQIADVLGASGVNAATALSAASAAYEGMGNEYIKQAITNTTTGGAKSLFVDSATQAAQATGNIQQLHDISQATGRSIVDSARLQNELGYTSDVIKGMQDSGFTQAQINRAADLNLSPQSVKYWADQGNSVDRVLNEYTTKGNFNDLANTAPAPVAPTPTAPAPVAAAAPSAGQAAAQARTNWGDLQPRTFANGETVYYSPSAYGGSGGTVSFDADGTARVHGWTGDPVDSGAQVGTKFTAPAAPAPVQQTTPVPEPTVQPVPEPIKVAPIQPPEPTIPTTPGQTPAPLPNPIGQESTVAPIQPPEPTVPTTPGQTPAPLPNPVGQESTVAPIQPPEPIVTPPTVSRPPAGSVPVQMPDGSVNYYDGNKYYDLAGQEVSVTTPTAGPGTDVAGPYTPAQEAQYNELIKQGKTPAEATDIIEGGQSPTDTGFKVDVRGTAGFEGNPTAVTGPLTPGSQLATQAEIDAGQARFNEAANAWEVTPPAPAPAPAPAPVLPAPVTNPAQALPIVQTPPVVTPEPVAEPPPLAPVQPVTITPSQPIPEVVAQSPAPVVTPTPVPPPVVTPTPVPEYTGPGIGETPNPAEVPVRDAVPVAVPERPVIPPPPIQPGTVPVEDAVANPPGTPQPGLGGYTMPPVSATDLALLAAGWYYLNGVLTPPKAATRAPYGPIAPPNWGTTGALVNPGLNPGFVRPPKFYNTTSPVQAQYNWGQHPYQPGPTFDPLAYNNVAGATPQPWGLQQLYTPTDINQYVATQPVAPKV